MPVDWQLLFKGIFFYGIGAVLHILLRKNRRQYISHESVWVLQQERTRALCWGLYNHTFCENFYERYPITISHEGKSPEVEEYEEVLSSFGEETPEDIWDRAVALDFGEEELFDQ